MELPALDETFFNSRESDATCGAIGLVDAVLTGTLSCSKSVDAPGEAISLVDGVLTEISLSCSRRFALWEIPGFSVGTLVGF